MITALLVLTTLSAAPQTGQPTAGEVISEMFQRYYKLNSLTGTIKLTISAAAPTGTVTEEVATVVQYQQPNKLFIRQDRGAPHARTWIISSDGKSFSYDFPERYGVHSVTKRLEEPVGDNDVAHIYAAGSFSIGDRSAPLGIALSWTDELRRIKAEWMTFDLAGEVTYQGAKVWKITGDYRESPVGSKTGQYALLVSKAGDLLEFETQQIIATPTATGGHDAEHPTTLTMTWQAALNPNGTPDPSLFKVVK